MKKEELTCPRCGGDKEPDAKWCLWCVDWQERFDEALADDAWTNREGMPEFQRVIPMTRTTDLPTGRTAERLAMNSHAARWLKPEDRAAIERAIPDGYRMTVMYGTAPGDWSIRIFECTAPEVHARDGHSPVDDPLCIIQRHQRTIKGGAFVALAKLAAAGVSV